MEAHTQITYDEWNSSNERDEKKNPGEQKSKEKFK